MGKSRIIKTLVVAATFGALVVIATSDTSTLARIGSGVAGGVFGALLYLGTFSGKKSESGGVGGMLTTRQKRGMTILGFGVGLTFAFAVLAWAAIPNTVIRTAATALFIGTLLATVAIARKIDRSKRSDSP